MASSRKNKQALFVDKECIATLALAQEGLLAPVTGLMNEKTAEVVNKTKMYNGKTFPFPFMTAPRGRRNEQTLKSAPPGTTLDLVCEGQWMGELTVEEVFPLDPLERVRQIYGTDDPTHPGVQATFKRLGYYAVSGPYRVEYPSIRANKQQIAQAKQKIGASKTSALMMAAKPLHRAHERLIRTTLENSDLVVIFLFKHNQEQTLCYKLRHRALEYFIQRFIPNNKIIIVPFENTYLFGGYNELILDAIVAQNFGCDELVVGHNHAGLGLYYDKNRLNSIFDNCQGHTITIKPSPEYFYCDICRTLVSSYTCPHGEHHHISYHAKSIMELLYAGLIPPAVLVRKEISAMYLSELFPDRFKKIEELYYNLMPGSGLLEWQSEEEFYVKLSDLYQTTSLN